MPSHQIRVQQNNCEHIWRITYGVDIAELIHRAKICIKCNKIVDLGVALSLSDLNEEIINSQRS